MSFDINEPTSHADFLPMDPIEKSVSVEAANARQIEEVKAQIFMAKQFPRDQQVAFNNIMNACKRKKVAEEAEYEFPKGGSKVTGPTIRLAEVLAQNWGNMDVGLVELEQRNGASQVLSYAWDLETNTRVQMTFTVRHERKAKGRVNQLEDPRDIYEMVAGQGARRRRACILAVIPGDIVEAAIAQCRKTLIDSYTEPLSDRVRKALQQFDEKYSVSPEAVEKYIGCSIEAFTENDYLRLGNVWRSLRDNMAKREDYFEIPKPKVEGDSPLNEGTANETE